MGGGGDSEGDASSGEILAFVALASTASETESALARRGNFTDSPFLVSSLGRAGRFLD
jgi:hypothetical protein